VVNCCPGSFSAARLALNAAGAQAVPSCNAKMCSVNYAYIGCDSSSIPHNVLLLFCAEDSCVGAFPGCINAARTPRQFPDKGPLMARGGHQFHSDNLGGRWYMTLHSKPVAGMLAMFSSVGASEHSA
jgi:hypothetical protein